MWWIMLAGASALFTLVMVLLFLAMRRSALTAAVPERSWLLHGGLLLPSLVLPPLAVYGFVVGERTLARPAEPALRIEATSQRWSWNFAYPDAPPGPGTADILHIPAGQPVEILVHSTDVIHSFWVPRLAGKIDAIPGRVNRIRLTAARPGTYPGLCAEFCGRHHAEMAFSVVAHDPAGYAAALAEARAAR
jgi:cytochrome c oxidase subunit 2